MNLGALMDNGVIFLWVTGASLAAALFILMDG
jgi:hypothetical protein